MPHASSASQETLRLLSQRYYDLNGGHYDILERPPTALEFSRIAHISRPVVIRGSEIPALTHWTNDYLINQMGDRLISVAVTPDGRADAITPGPSGELHFVEPHTEQMTMADLLSRLSPKSCSQEQDVYYLQSQNGNMYTAAAQDSTSELEPLRRDVPREIPWCSEAFGRHPDAVNVWIGGNDSVTSIHSDPYENIYVVVRGSKQFTLLPPTDGWALEERSYPHATYTRCSPSQPLTLTPSSQSTHSVRWSSIADPHLPGTLPRGAHPMHITVNAGETLYLPAGWWHHVRQGGTPEGDGVTIALNWWYDIEMRGMSWVWLTFLRGTEEPDGSGSESEDELL